jgi:carbonic anhydrase/acetyltransferase-like protein (isoleucine patch superfamily)
MVVYFAGIDGARFKRPVEPGDQLILEAAIDRAKRASTSTRRATRGRRGRVVEAELMCTMRRAGTPEWRMPHPSKRHRRPGGRTGDHGEVGPYTVIGAARAIGAGTTIGAHCVIEGPPPSAATTASSSSIRSGRAAGHEVPRRATALDIGDRNTIREFCTFNTGTRRTAGVTRVGDDNWVMAYVHLAHDVQVGNHTILANNATLAGHVHVGDWAIIGGLTGCTSSCHRRARDDGFQSRMLRRTCRPS